MKSQGILLVGSFLSGTGRGSHSPCEDLAVRLTNGGWRVLCTSNRLGRMARITDMIRAAWALRHEYSVALVDVYSGNAFYWAEAVCFVLRQLSRPYAVTLRGGNLPEFARRHPRRVSALLASAAAVTSPSRYMQQELQTYHPHITLLPNPIDLARYPFSPRSRPKPTLLWLRAFHRIYNPCLAVQVLCRIRQTYPKASLTMIGPDKGDGTMSDVRDLARRLGVADACTLIPGVPKGVVPRYMDRCDLFLNTTDIDNTPVSVLEAMACGLCVVSTNVGGLTFLLTNERNALLVPPRDPDAMASAVSRVLDDPGLAQGLSHAGRQTALECDWQVVYPQWEQLLERIVSRAVA